MRSVVRTALALSLAAVASAAAQPTSGSRTPDPLRRDVRDLARGAGRALERAAQTRESQRATERFDPIFRKYSKRYFGIGADWRWFKAQGMAESDLTPTARSRVGARGVMQLMPSTYKLISSRRPEFGPIDDPEWNIAAGIMHDRYLWGLWERDVHEGDRWDFVFGSYNAGEGTIARARRLAAESKLDRAQWRSIERVAPNVPRWRYTETLEYVRRIRANHGALPVR